MLAGAPQLAADLPQFGSQSGLALLPRLQDLVEQVVGDGFGQGLILVESLGRLPRVVERTADARPLTVDVRRHAHRDDLGRIGRGLADGDGVDVLHAVDDLAPDGVLAV